MKRLVLVLAACGGSSATSVDSPTSIDSPGTPDVASPVDCSSATAQLDKIVCQANGFLGTLSSTQQTSANPAFTDTASRTKWSNLPTATAAACTGSPCSARRRRRRAGR